MRRMIPMASRVLKGKRGITHAVKTGGLYHLWFHPFNLNEDTEAMLSGLATIFDYAHHMREQGLLEILTMDDYVRRLEREKLAEPHRAERGLPKVRAEAQLSVKGSLRCSRRVHGYCGLACGEVRGAPLNEARLYENEADHFGAHYDGTSVP